MESKQPTSKISGDEIHDDNKRDDSVDNPEINSSPGEASKSVSQFHEEKFRNSAKYKDCDSYSSQHHHSIGTGLFLTDEIRDLPPRFKDKVIRALEEAAAINNIPLNCDALKLISSAKENSKEKEETSDSLVTFSLPKIDYEFPDRKNNDFRTSVETNSNRKRCYSSESNISQDISKTILSNKFSDRKSDFKPSFQRDSNGKQHYSSVLSESNISQDIPKNISPKDSPLHTTEHNSSSNNSLKSSKFIYHPKSSAENLNRKFDSAVERAKWNPKYLPLSSKSILDDKIISIKASSKSSQAADLSNEHISNDAHSSSYVNKQHNMNLQKQYQEFLSKNIENGRQPPSEEVDFSSDNRNYKVRNKFFKGKKQYQNKVDLQKNISCNDSRKCTENKQENLINTFFPNLNTHKSNDNSQNNSVYMKNDSNFVNSLSQNSHLDGTTIKSISEYNNQMKNIETNNCPKSINTTHNFSAHSSHKITSPEIHCKHFDSVSFDKHNMSKVDFRGKTEITKYSKQLSPNRVLDKHSLNFRDSKQNHSERTFSNHSDLVDFAIVDKKLDSIGKCKTKISVDNNNHATISEKHNVQNNAIARTLSPDSNLCSKSDYSTSKLNQTKPPNSNFKDDSFISKRRENIKHYPKSKSNITNYNPRNIRTLDKNCDFISCSKSNDMDLSKDKHVDEEKDLCNNFSKSLKDIKKHDESKWKNSNSSMKRIDVSSLDSLPVNNNTLSHRKFHKTSAVSTSCNTESYDSISMKSGESSVKNIKHKKPRRDVKSKFEDFRKFDKDISKVDTLSVTSNSSINPPSYDSLSHFENVRPPIEHNKCLNTTLNQGQTEYLPNVRNVSNRNMSQNSNFKALDEISLHSFGNEDNSKKYHLMNKKFNQENGKQQYRDDNYAKNNGFLNTYYKRNRKHNPRGCVDLGFYVKVEVSENIKALEYWVSYFKILFPFKFDLERCCHFSDILILTFEDKQNSLKGISLLKKQKKELLNSEKPHVIFISNLKTHLVKPCNCRQNVVIDSIENIEKNAFLSLNIMDKKIKEIEMSNGKSFHLSHNYNEVDFTKIEMLKSYKDSECNFNRFKECIISKVEEAENLRSIQHFKLDFIRECNAFKRCLPIYSKKEDILTSVQYNSVTIIVAETGSGKSTQLVDYILHSEFYDDGFIVCTQPRKLAAVNIAQFVSGQMGSAVGKIVGYDVGMEKKISHFTKIIYMTDYCLLKTYLRNNNLKGISYVIIDEAHERSLYTDLLLGMLKDLIKKRYDIRVIITSATINPKVFIHYFQTDNSVITVPGRSYPVDVIWWPETIDINWNYVTACVEKAYEIHCQGKEGDILVFLTSPVEAEEAINRFKRMSNQKGKVLLFCLHGKSDLREQMQVFQVTPHKCRKIIFATNVAETSVTIPGIKYVIDSGMTRELLFDSKKSRNYLAVTFINKSSAEQRKGRAGRTQSGVCYRMYSERNFMEHMPDNATPEILKTNLQKALLKIIELGIEPQKFDFIETPPKKTISNSIDSLEYLGAIKNNKLTSLGKKLVKLPLEPQLSKLIFLGIEAGIGYESIIIAALILEAGKLFLRFEDNKAQVDEKKKKFCQVGGDLCTYLEIFKRWHEVDFHNRFDWCVQNFLSSKALNAARNTIREIILSLKVEFGISVSKHYSNSFKTKYERILFDSFSENLCVSSGHPKLGYLSPFLPESFFIHPSSTLSCLGKDIPEYLIYSTLMETSRNFLFDITPISEETIKQSNEAGNFALPVYSLKSFQISPKILGPFGESILIRHILGKNGSKIKDIETRIKDFTKTKNAQVDVTVDKGLITVYVAEKYHEKIAKDINEIIGNAHLEMLKEEDVIKLAGSSIHYAMTAGGIINDIIMAGEFREIVISDVKKGICGQIENLLKSFGSLQSVNQVACKQIYQISATYKTVDDAIKAFRNIDKLKCYKVSPKPYLPNVNDETLPLFMLNVSWCRLPCNGNGWVEFMSEEDLIAASGILTASSFYLNESFIMFSPCANNTKKLTIKNLPGNADENTLKIKLSECLPEHLKIKQICILRKIVKATDNDTQNAKKKLEGLLTHFTSSNKLVIDLKNPRNEAMWRASVYFENYKHGEEAYRKLKGNFYIDSYEVSMTKIIKSSLYCKTEVYEAISNFVKAVLLDKRKQELCIEFNIKQCQSGDKVQVEFICESVQKLNKVKLSLMNWILGESLDFIGASKYHFLFYKSFASIMESIQKSTNTFINLNKFRKLITIHGFMSNIEQAKLAIHKIASDPELLHSRVFNLLDSCIPKGFLKNVYVKYGYDLHGLVDSFELTGAEVNSVKSTLTLTGKKRGIKKAEQVLEKLCEKLYNLRRGHETLKENLECCPICLEPVSYDFFRLEYCGHALCRECLILQIESKSIPLVCSKQNCEKFIFLEDIKRIISFGNNHLKKEFCSTALQYFVSCNVGKISYCPTPDCQMIYRVTINGSEYKCPECQNSICTSCKTFYHYGMTCDMFQNCKNDEDYSVKMWMKENMSNRKSCPSCNAVIEKDGGCNHVECINCKVHLCWLCLEIFPESEKVYEHMPFCKNNQQ